MTVLGAIVQRILQVLAGNMKKITDLKIVNVQLLQQKKIEEQDPHHSGIADSSIKPSCM